MGESWEPRTLIDRESYENLSGGIKGGWGVEWLMRSFFMFFFLFCGGGGGSENVQEFTLQLLEMEILFSWINFG